MRFGYRKPSWKKSFKARTTGKWKRQMKRSINPYYGKKGAGWVNNPRKAMYNKVYNKTSRSIFSQPRKQTRKKINYTNDIPKGSFIYGIDSLFNLIKNILYLIMYLIAAYLLISSVI
ncbi:hypothetical protein [Apilactobacillus timberlakei]|uniref:hypothetical protein n=1 Tax=Apilactobacillus timberlakei TaxID=2008380 RepID=UPI001CDC89A6|nr:hypothetical protein [Apilactobacillus timberlakei]